jgi:hypothetical protein
MIKVILHPYIVKTQYINHRTDIIHVQLLDSNGMLLWKLYIKILSNFKKIKNFI